MALPAHPLLFPGPYLLSTRKRSELAARRVIKKIFGRKPPSINKFLDHTTSVYQKMIEYIRQELKMSLLLNIKPPLLIIKARAIGLPRFHLCLHCWQGQ